MTASKRNVQCRACRTPLPPDVLLDLGEQPLANNLCQGEVHHDNRYPLQVVRCGECGLLQLTYVVEPHLMFGHYLYTPSQSVKTLAHFQALATAASKRVQGGRCAVDIGSNDGALLRFLMNEGWSAVGVDPAENLAAQANKDGLPTLCRFFDNCAVDEIIRMQGHAHLVTANNVFAHTPDWGSFMAGIDRLLAPGGLLALEFPYGPDMLMQGTFDLIYFEHASFPALAPLQSLLLQMGLWIVDVDHFPAIHGGSVRVWVGRQKEHPPVANIVFTLEEVLYSESACLRFAHRVEHLRTDLVAAVREAKGGGRVFGYTAPAKAVTLLEFCGLTASDIEFIVDDNPLKQGRMLPGSHIPVISVQEANIQRGDTAVVFAWNVVDDILTRLPPGVSVIIPMPDVRVIQS